MKIRVIEYKTEIEADARELRESNTLAGNFAQMLSRCFKSNEPFDDEPFDDEEDGGEQDERSNQPAGGD